MALRFHLHWTTKTISLYPARMRRMGFLVFLILLTSCTSRSTIDHSAMSCPLTITETSQSIWIALHRECIIALQSNPTTGYTWTLSIEPAGVITTKSKEFIANASDRVGVGGTTSWLLMANRVGSTTLTFHYQRPWETGVKPTREVVYKFKVY